MKEQRETERHREKGRQTDEGTERQKDRERITGRQTDEGTERDKKRKTQMK